MSATNANPEENQESRSSRLHQTAIVPQTDLANVGLTAEIISYEWGEYLKRSNDPKLDGAVLAGWTADNGDADSFLTPLLACASVGGNNKAVWCNKDFDALLDKARAESDDAKRNDLYQKAQQIAADESPWIPIANGLITVVTSAKVSVTKSNRRMHTVSMAWT